MQEGRLRLETCVGLDIGQDLWTPFLSGMVIVLTHNFSVAFHVACYLCEACVSMKSLSIRLKTFNLSSIL